MSAPPQAPSTPTARVAWFNCFAGIAGDMALGSLVDAGADLREIETMRCQVHPVAGYVFESDPRRIARAYFVAAAPEEEKR